MKIAIFADVHSNLLALNAVLSDIKQRGIEAVYCAGDLVGYGPRPNEVIESLKLEKIPSVMGNYDDAIGNHRMMCGCDYKDEKALSLGEASVRWTKEQTTEDNKLWLRELPQRIQFSTQGKNVLLVHGSPRQLNEYLFEDTSDEYLSELLTENNSDILVCGHTHLPYHKTVTNGHVINVGSAGKPKHGNPNVTYAVIGVEADRVFAEFIEVAYDYEKTAREIEEFGLPYEFADKIRKGTP